jgi:hypothetical protein
MSANRFRVLLVSLLAVFAVSAVASASASASACPAEHEGDYAICYEGTEFEGKLEGTSGVSILKSTVLTKEVEIECTADTISVTAEDSGKSKGELHFTNCKVNKPAGCKVTEPIVAKFTDQLNTPPAAITDTFTGSGTAEEFTAIKITGCALEGTYKIKGKQTCSFDANIGTDQVEHEVICTFAGSALKLGSEPATFSSTAKVHVVDDESEDDGDSDLWSIFES